MATENHEADEPVLPKEGALHHLEHTVAEHLRAAEVAMEEAAGYGEVTAIIKGAEAAVAPQTELGSSEEDETPPAK